MDNGNVWIFLQIAIGLIVIFTLPFSKAYTYEQDVFAINSLYVALGSPPLPGWVPNGGDPCTEGWQGVQCVNSNITAITINSANLGGQLSDTLGNFSSLITIDLSNNNIGGSIPENLPMTMQRFFLSGNQLTGSIPISLSQLTLLTDMSLNNNHLTGVLPDAFHLLTSLINLDLSDNNFTGQLPPSMGSLTSLTTLHLENNQLTGILDVLEDLPLQDLNIENNLFSGPVPQKLLVIPNFKKDGNPFNTSIAPSSIWSPSPSPLSMVPTPDMERANSSNGSNAQETLSPTRKNSMSTIKIIGYVLAVVSIVVIVLVLIFCISKYQERRSSRIELSKGPVGRAQRPVEEPKIRECLIKPNNEASSVAEELSEKQECESVSAPDQASKKEKQHVIDVGGTGVFVMPPPPVERVIVNPIIPSENIRTNHSPEKINSPTSVASFSVASLQQYTNSFREENMIRDGRVGKVFLAELPDGELLEVMKIDNVNSRIAVDEFLELVVSISELRHPHILELVGYCAEFEQRLLVYKHFSRKTLHDVLHCGDDLKIKLSWNARLCIALEAAKALEYLHEGCQPPVIHQNFEPAGILLNNKLTARVSECGLAMLMSSNSATQLSGRIRALFSYEAPETNESGLYTDRSDVYSFGVVMLELLTGRKPYDSSRPRVEQHLVRWASSQLYDIDALSGMVDPSIKGKCSEKSLSRFADIINRCVQQGPEFRPPISEVVQDLSRMVKDLEKATN
ncbi:protein STRUBBELIG-RECEPTOR FAMILY 3 isoform X1 [Typha angustifolia]|uniref:protein STRUBBELIG-RECEPTOR FAMILY 3 isoform X1 n=1 Tax=Typha angustifolia TaxID=59011 RepID=UPI003C2EBF83